MSTYDQAAAERHWFDLTYWLANYPDVRLNAADNGHVPARTLRVAWNGPGAPPIVAVQITPRGMQAPSKPGGTEWLGIATAVVGSIPGLGAVARGVLSVVKTGIGIGQGLALQDWAHNFKASPDDFSPQYSPQSFLIPMPLDRAQIMVSRPWYAPAMLYQFQKEIATNALLTTPAAYSAILQAMLQPGQSDPPPSTKGEAPLFTFVEPVRHQTEPAKRGNGAPANLPANVPANLLADTPAPRLADSTPRKPTGALPLLVVGGLAFLGAPLLLVGAVAVAVLGRKT